MMKKENNNLTIVGQHKQMMSWLPVNITHTKVIKGLTYSEVKSKGLAQIYREKTGKKATEGSLYHFVEPQYPKPHDKEELEEIKE